MKQTTLSVSEFAGAKNVHRNTVLYWITKNKLPKGATAKKVGKQYMLTFK
jgi:DNA-binding transcriptional regulator YiaG